MSSAPQPSVGRECGGKPKRAGGVATRPADEDLLVVHRSDHRVLDPHVDGAVVGQESVGDVAQALERVLVPVGDRLVRAVAAGEHERVRVLVAQQVVQRRVGQHQPDGPVPGGGVGEIGIQEGGEHDRVGGVGQQRLGRPVDLPDARASTRSPTRTANGFSAVLAGSKHPARLLVACGGCEVVPTRPLTATARPPLRRAAALAVGSPSSSRPAPPAGGAARRPGNTLLAWKRRSDGSSYSRRHASQSSKAAIVVLARSIGMSRTMVKRGPHRAQFTNG